MKKAWKFVFVLAVFMASAALAQAQGLQIATKGKAAVQLVEALNLPLPADFAQKSPEKQFQICVGLLEEKGVTAFKGSSAGEQLSRKFLARAVIVLAPNVPALIVTEEDKINYLERQGVLATAGALDADAMVTEAELAAALTSPVITGSPFRIQPSKK